MNISTGPAGRPWRFDLVLDEGASVPRQTQLSRALVQEIQRGRLLPGSTLPGSRTLAAQLKVNRKVVVAAVDELVAQGWLEALPARGTRVALNLPTLAVADAEGRRSVETVLDAAERRMHLRRICESFGLCIVEDDYDYEYHFEGASLLPPSATKDLSSRCIYIASLSKLIAPAIRLGYIIADRSVVARLRAVRELLDRQGDVVLERAVAELIEDGAVQRHARRARQLYRQRRDHLLQELASRSPLRAAIACDPPGGGLALWVRLRSLTSEELVKRARARDLALTPGSAHVAAGFVPAFRFGFAAHTSEELSRICDALEACLQADSGSKRR